MQLFVDEILTPYFEQKKRELNLPPMQKSLWVIDVWSVHRSDEFLSWMCKNHPTILIDFVSGGCTGVAQPLDVGINWIFKHSLKLSYYAKLIDNLLSQLKKKKPLKEGVDDSDIMLSDVVDDVARREPKRR
uniref:DDE-1 domain-containing protein n=1 Tax=Moniliophthora roreri TaxID=221103 RepID=A0A0W0G3V9_MONRR